MRVILAGSSELGDPGQVWAELDRLAAALPRGETLTVVEGGEVAGADKYARDWVSARGRAGAAVRGETITGDRDLYGGQIGPECSAELVASGADVALAFPIGASPGTRHYIDLVTTANIPIRVVEPRQFME